MNITAGFFRAMLRLKASLDDWAARTTGEVHLDKSGLPDDDEFREINWGDDLTLTVLNVLRTEYVNDLKARFGSEPTVQKLAVVQKVLTAAADDF